MTWRVGLVDSCGTREGALAAARFVRCDGRVDRVAAGADASGHGTRIAHVIAARADVRFAMAQVFDGSGRTAADVVAAAMDWCVEIGVDLIHLSLGLAADRECLAEATRRAVGAGCLVVASVPARGPVPYPAAYPGVIRATGDARCSPSQVAMLGPETFGGCPSVAEGSGGGASIGAAHVTARLLGATPGGERALALARLVEIVDWHGPERRGAG